jgi:hypothetical protein
MDTDWIIGALAFITIGGVLALSIFHFFYYLKDPKNLAAARSVAEDRESAATKMSSEGVNGRSLRQRLDEAPALRDRLSNRYIASISLDELLNTKWSVLKESLAGQKL